MNLIEKGFNNISEFSKTNAFSKIGGIFILWLIGLIPIYIYFIFKFIFGPVGFWQNITLFVLWCLGLGWLQIFMLLLVIPATIFILEES